MVYLEPLAAVIQSLARPKKILLIHKEKEDLRSKVEKTTEEHNELCVIEENLTKSIALCVSKEEEIDAQVVQYAADLKRTREQMNFGKLDFDTGTAQSQAPGSF